MRNECEACGVAKLGINKCDIWNKCELEADVLEWVHADQQGSKNGKQNTQLELGKRRYKVHVILSKLIDQLEKCRLHQAQYEWRGWMKNIDLTMSKPNIHQALCTDFGVMLDLFGLEKENSSVDNHAFLCIFFVLSNWRNVNFKKE